MNLCSLFFNTWNVISKTTLENSYSFKFKQCGIRTWVFRRLRPSALTGTRLRRALLHQKYSRILVSGSFNSWMWLVCFWSNTSTVLERHMKSVHRWTWGNIGSLNTGRMLFELFWNHFYFLAPLNFNLLKKQLMPPHMEVQYRVALKGGVHCTLLLSIKIMLLVGGPWASKLTNLLGFICILGGWLPYHPFKFLVLI